MSSPSSVISAATQCPRARAPPTWLEARGDPDRRRCQRPCRRFWGLLSWPALYIIIKAAAALRIRSLSMFSHFPPRPRVLLHRLPSAITPLSALLDYLPSPRPFAFPSQLHLSPQLTPHGLCFDALAPALRIRAAIHCRGLRFPLHDSGTVRLQTILGP